MITLVTVAVLTIDNSSQERVVHVLMMLNHVPDGSTGPHSSKQAAPHRMLPAQHTCHTTIDTLSIKTLLAPQP